MSNEERRNVTPVLRTADVRVVEYTLQAGDAHPWHFHSEVSDAIYCLEGLIGVETRDPSAEIVLHPGDKYNVPVKVVHHVLNAGQGQSRYLLLQGIGTYDYNKVA